MFTINRLKNAITGTMLMTACNCAEGYSLAGDVGVGYRQDQLNWNIDGGSVGPNILSELKWKNLGMVNFYGQLRARAPFCSYVRLTGSYGKIVSGNNTDWDYHGDHRTDPFSFSKNKADRGEAFEVSTALGVVFDWIPCATIIPLAGYSLQEQHLQFYDGTQVFLEGSSSHNTPIHGLASNYRVKWYTPFIGADLFFHPRDRWKLIATGEWHWGKFRANGFWNLRTDFLSDVRQRANGTGVVGRVQALYLATCHLTCGFAAEYIAMNTRPGINEVDINIEANRIATARGALNAVHWRSWRIMITGGFDF